MAQFEDIVTLFCFDSEKKHVLAVGAVWLNAIYTDWWQRDISMLFSINHFKPACLFSLFKQLNRREYCVLLLFFRDVNLWWLQTAVGTATDVLVTCYKWLLAAHTQPQQKSRRKMARLWCGEFSFTSVLPTGAQGNIGLWGSQTQQQTCCAERSPTSGNRHGHRPSEGLNPLFFFFFILIMASKLTLLRV